MTDKQKIRAKIGKLKSEYNKESDFRTVRGDTAREVLDKLLSFIDSLPEEPASEDLEEEINHISKNEYFDFSDWKSIARHFAEWQKQQMMKNAVETTIVNDWQYGKDPDHAIIPAIHQRIEGFNVGNKVKITILKND